MAGFKRCLGVVARGRRRQLGPPPFVWFRKGLGCSFLSNRTEEKSVQIAPWKSGGNNPASK